VSEQTTNFGPRVSVTTTHTNEPSAGHFEVAIPYTLSNSGTVSGALAQSGDITSTATIDASGGRVLSRVSTLSATSAAGSLRDGEFGFFHHRASAISLEIRSGQTTYFFSSDGASVA
jgi:hypothetical protein